MANRLHWSSGCLSLLEPNDNGIIRNFKFALHMQLHAFCGSVNIFTLCTSENLELTRSQFMNGNKRLPKLDRKHRKPN